MSALKALRHKGLMKKFLWVLAVVIIISFGFFGTANYLGGSGRAAHAGKMFGRNVNFDEFNQVKQETTIQLIMQYGDAFFKIREFLNVNAQTWDRMILLDEAGRRNIRIDDQDVVAYIQNIPFFQRNNQFDSLLYNDILRESFRIQPRDFEEAIRNSLKIKTLFGEETLHVSVTDEEIEETFKMKNEKVQISYVLFSPKEHPVTKAFSDEEAKNYYEKNLNQFLMPSGINLKYIELAFNTEITDEAKKVLDGEAHDIYTELTNSKSSLETAAERHSLKVRETGFFSQEQPDIKPGWTFSLLQRAFQLKENEVSEPIQTDSGIYILQLKDRRDSYIPEFAEARTKVVEALRGREAEELARRQAESYGDIIRNANIQSREAFADEARKHGLEILQTPVFSRGQYLPKIGLSKNFQEAAFGLSDGDKVSPIVETEAGFCILHRDSYVPVDKEEFEKEKEEITKAITAQRQEETFNEFLNTLRLQANLEDYASKTETRY